MYSLPLIRRNILYNLASCNLIYLQKKCGILINKTINCSIDSEDSAYILNGYFEESNNIIDIVMGQRNILMYSCLYDETAVLKFHDIVNRLHICVYILNEKYSELFVLFPYVYLGIELE